MEFDLVTVLVGKNSKQNIKKQTTQRIKKKKDTPKVSSRTKVVPWQLEQAHQSVACGRSPQYQSHRP